MNLKLLENFVSKDVITNIIAPYLLPEKRIAERRKTDLNRHFKQYYKFYRDTKPLKRKIDKCIKEEENAISKLIKKSGPLFNYHNKRLDQYKSQKNFIRNCDHTFKMRTIDDNEYIYRNMVRVVNKPKQISYFFFVMNIYYWNSDDEEYIVHIKNNDSANLMDKINCESEHGYQRWKRYQGNINEIHVSDIMLVKEDKDNDNDNDND